MHDAKIADATVRTRDALQQDNTCAIKMQRLAKILADNRHGFYDPLTKEILPAYGTFIHSVYAEIHKIDYKKKMTGRWPEEEIILQNLPAEDTPLVQALAYNTLVKQRKHTLSSNGYFQHAQQCIAKLKGNLILMGHNALMNTYEALSLLCNLCMLPLQETLLRFGTAQDIASQSPTYRPVSGKKLLDHLTLFAQVIHQFTCLECSTQAIHILNMQPTHAALNTNKIAPIIKKIQEVVADNIIFYIIAHINEEPANTMPIISFDRDIVSKYFAKVDADIHAVEKDYIAQHHTEIVRYFDALLFAQIPSRPLVNYNQKNKQILEEHTIYRFHYVKIIGRLLLFIDPIFESMMSYRLQTTLLLNAEWGVAKQKQTFIQTISDIRILKQEMLSIDEHILDRFHTTHPLKTVLYHFEFFDEADKLTTIDRIKHIDNQFLELIQIFQHLLTYMVVSLQSIYEDLRTYKGEIITNWGAIRKKNPSIEHNIMRLIKVFGDFRTLVEGLLVPIAPATNQQDAPD